MQEPRGLFESLGFGSVGSVIASGNLVFEATVRSMNTIRRIAEKYQ